MKLEQMMLRPTPNSDFRVLKAMACTRIVDKDFVFSARAKGTKNDVGWEVTLDYKPQDELLSAYRVGEFLADRFPDVERIECWPAMPIVQRFESGGRITWYLRRAA